MSRSPSLRSGHQSNRIDWIDGVRGFAILLVVAFHSTSLLRFGYEVPPVLVQINAIFGPYRMHSLAFLAGLIAHLSLSKPLPKFVMGKARNIVWPYIVWTVVFSITIGSSYSWLDHEMYFSYMWYLLFLIAYLAAAKMLSNIPPIIVVLCAFVASAVIPGSWSTVHRFFYLMGFFFLGLSAHVVAQGFDRLLDNGWTIVLAVPVLATSAFAYAWVDVKYDTAWVFGSIAGVLLLCAISRWVFPLAALRWMTFIGRNSLVYYVSHVPVIYVCIVVASPFIGSAYIAAAIAFASALMVGTALAWGNLRLWPVSLLFRFVGPAATRNGRSNKVGRARS